MVNTDKALQLLFTHSHRPFISLPANTQMYIYIWWFTLGASAADRLQLLQAIRGAIVAGLVEKKMYDRLSTFAIATHTNIPTMVYTTHK